MKNIVQKRYLFWFQSNISKNLQTNIRGMNFSKLSKSSYTMNLMLDSLKICKTPLDNSHGDDRTNTDCSK